MSDPLYQRQQDLTDQPASPAIGKHLYISNVSGGTVTYSYVAPNTTTSVYVLTMTGTGSAGAAPTYLTADAAGLVDKSSTQTGIGGAKTWTGTHTFNGAGLVIGLSGYISGRTISFATTDGGNPSISSTSNVLQVGAAGNGAIVGIGTYFNNATGFQQIGSSYGIGFSNGGPSGGTLDITLYRIAVGVLGIGSTGQTGNSQLDARARNFTVATLPTAGSGTKGRVAFATNGVKVSESTGGGTGTLCYDDGTAWRRVGDDTTVIA